MNDYPDSDNFTLDEEVMLVLGAGREVRGVVRKVTASRVVVEHEGGKTEVLHRRKYGRPFMCRRISQRDVAREQWKNTYAAWEKARPALKLLSLTKWYQYGDYQVSMPRNECASPDTLRALVDEANLLGEWLAQRPPSPKDPT